MTINTKELIEAVSVVSDNHNIRVTVKSSLKASAVVAGFTFVGGLMLGPLGIPIGATAGGLYSYSRTKGSFKSAAVILREEMTDEQKEKLCGHIVEAFKGFQAQDLAMLIPLLMSSGQFQTIVVKQVVEFLTNEMRLQIID